MKSQSKLQTSEAFRLAPVTATISHFAPQEAADETPVKLISPISHQANADVRNPPRFDERGEPVDQHRDQVTQHEFLKQIQREKRRAERTKAPLSIAIFRSPPTAPEIGSGSIEYLLKIICQVSRTTDTVALVADDSVAVLCTDTDEQGIAAYLKKVKSLAGDYLAGVTTATYPDLLFENLTILDQLSPELQQFVFNTDSPKQASGYRLKRFIDVVGALTALTLLAPLMMLVATTIALTSRGPVLFRQKRLGKSGVPFECYKFRSMVANNDESLHRDFVTALIKGESNTAPPDSTNGPAYKIKRDPRVTWIGRIIRKTSVDELPQLFNVLKGEMSLVGPRPPIPYEAENYQAWHLRRLLDATPGITGLWQVEGRSSVTFNDMVRLDLRYIRECSLSLDLKILLKTIRVVIRCDGAV